MRYILTTKDRQKHLAAMNGDKFKRVFREIGNRLKWIRKESKMLSAEDVLEIINEELSARDLDWSDIDG